MPNPLECGADTYGGSTHKTFPGPHKAVLFTNRDDLFERITLAAVNMISHHHTADVISLAIAADEFAECGGRDYAARILMNAKSFAEALAEEGFNVVVRNGEFTRTHQVWFDAGESMSAYAAGELLFEAGLIVNPYNPLPATGGPGIRLGLNEATRLGASDEDLRVLAKCFRWVLRDQQDPSTVGQTVTAIRTRLRPRYCHSPERYAKQLSCLFANVLNDVQTI
jgi:glycine/serine hydroxymethyltransferase